MIRRRTGLRTDPGQVADWQRRTRRLLPSRRARPRRLTAVAEYEQLSPTKWYTACLARRGRRCRVPGCNERRVELDHLIPRSQGGPYIVPNGLPLCGAWSATVPGGHHAAKTRHELRIHPAWLDEDQIEWLAATRLAWWDDAGEVHGQHRRLFATAGDGATAPRNGRSAPAG